MSLNNNTIRIDNNYNDFNSSSCCCCCCCYNYHYGIYYCNLVSLN